MLESVLPKQCKYKALLRLPRLVSTLKNNSPVAQTPFLALR